MKSIHSGSSSPRKSAGNSLAKTSFIDEEPEPDPKTSSWAPAQILLFRLLLLLSY